MDVRTNAPATPITAKDRVHPSMLGTPEFGQIEALTHEFEDILALELASTQASKTLAWKDHLVERPRAHNRPVPPRLNAYISRIL